MRKLLILLFLGTSPGYSGDGGTFFSFSLEKPIGFAWYDLEVTGPEESSSSGASGRPLIRSELNFPLDPFRAFAGFSSIRGTDSAGRGGLRTEIQAWASIGPAYLRMRDEDWYGARAESGTSRAKVMLKFSDTRSKSETFQYGGFVHRELGDFALLGNTWVAGLGADFSYYAYEMFGFEGRQRDNDAGSWVDVAYPGSEKVLTYRTYAVRSVVGLRSRERLLGLAWESRLHPLLYAHALDNHLLRMKEIEMDCLGAGGNLEVSLPMGRPGRAGDRPALWAPYFRADLEMAWGSMKQTYYADSPDTEEDETGQSVHGIRTSVNQWQLGLGLRVNLGM